MGDYEDIATNSHGRKKERNIKIPNKTPQMSCEYCVAAILAASAMRKARDTQNNPTLNVTPPVSSHKILNPRGIIKFGIIGKRLPIAMAIHG